MGERITIQLPAEVVEKVRELASKSGRGVEEEVGTLLVESLRRAEEREKQAWEAFMAVAETGLFDGPGDLAERHDEYLYGPKPCAK